MHKRGICLSGDRERAWRRMNYANDDERLRIGQYRGSYVPLALALLVSLAMWFVVGFSVWRAFHADRVGPGAKEGGK